MTTYVVTVLAEAVHCDCHVFSGDCLICRHIFWLCRRLCAGAEGTTLQLMTVVSTVSMQICCVLHDGVGYSYNNVVALP